MIRYYFQMHPHNRLVVLHSHYPVLGSDPDGFVEFARLGLCIVVHFAVDLVVVSCYCLYKICVFITMQQFVHLLFLLFIFRVL